MPVAVCKTRELELPDWVADFPFISEGEPPRMWLPQALFTNGQAKAFASNEWMARFTDVRVRSVWGRDCLCAPWPELQECEAGREGAVLFWRCTNAEPKLWRSM